MTVAGDNRAQVPAKIGRLILTERLDRIIQLQASGRVPERPALRIPARGPGLHGGLEDRLQREASTQFTARTHARRVRRNLDIRNQPQLA